MHNFTSIASHCTLNPVTCLMYVVNRESKSMKLSECNRVEDSKSSH